LAGQQPLRAHMKGGGRISSGRIGGKKRNVIESDYQKNKAKTRSSSEAG